MAAVTQQPGGGGGNRYRIGICDCRKNVGRCCLVCWCPCIAQCQASRRIGENLCVPCFFGMLPTAVKFRMLANIEQSMLEEACEWQALGCCSLCRLLNEMDERQMDMTRK